MKKDTAFCTQTGKTVRVIPEAEGEAGEDGSLEAAICLDMNHRCVTARCPVTNAPTQLMALRLVRSGVAGATERAKAVCPDCNRETVHTVVAWAQAVCLECGAARRWSELRKRS